MMGVNLYDYQYDALKRMKNGCILCGSVGSGKSRTAIAYYFTNNGGKLGDIYGRMRDPCQDLYIITTARKRDTLEWEGELAPFLLSADPEANQYNNKVIIDSWNNIKKYVDVKDSFFIFDEQRLIGNGTWVKSFYKIAKANEWILLSATPADVWTDYIPVFVANGFYRNRTEFLESHVIFDYHVKKYPKVKGYFGERKLKEYRDLILVTMDYCNKNEQHHEDVYCAYDILTYQRVMKDLWNVYEDRPLESASELCYCLRRVVNSDESRTQKLLEIVECHPKVIIFYNFDYELEILKNLSYGYSVDIAEWNGHRHEPIPDSDRWVYLVQYTAGNEGWNCTLTDTIIFFSQNYSYRVMVQASGRIDRLNSPFRDLYYYHLKSHSKIDMAINRAILGKKRFNENTFAQRFIFNNERKQYG